VEFTSNVEKLLAEKAPQDVTVARAVPAKAGQ
jgi:hypothetical protein